MLQTGSDKTDKTLIVIGKEENMKITLCTEKKHYAFDDARRCGAKTRKGTVCQSPSVKNRPRCRLHGCGKRSGAPKGSKNALTHGLTTLEAKTFRKEVRKVIKASRVLADEFG